MTKNAEAFPDTLYIDELVGPDSPAADLLRTSQLIETWSHGSPWFRRQLHQHADVQEVCDRMPQDKRAAIASEVGRISDMFERDNLAEDLARRGGLFTEPVPPHIRRRQLNILQGSWARVASRARDISTQPPQPVKEYGVGMSDPDPFSVRRFFAAANIGSFWLRLDARVMARANKKSRPTDSAFRENILSERPSGVKAFDRFHHELRFCALVGGLDTGLQALRQEWEQNKGQETGAEPFYPAGYDRECADKISVGLLGDVLHRVISQGAFKIAEARMNTELHV